MDFNLHHNEIEYLLNDKYFNGNYSNLNNKLFEWFDDKLNIYTRREVYDIIKFKKISLSQVIQCII